MSPSTGELAPCLVVRGVSKAFPGTRALADVDLAVNAGEIHALVGGNGSGKSTLIKILSGVYQADPGGEIEFGEVRVAADETTPDLARRSGVVVVHQDLGMFPDLSVAENIALGHGYPTGRGSRIRWTRVRKRTRELLDRFEIDAVPETLVRSLGQAARTQVAIARALQDDEATGDQGESRRRLLILDEATSSLPAHEVQMLLSILRRYAQAGQAILFVSHRLDEVLGVADRVTVLRDGTKIGTFDAADLDEDRLIELIVGRSVDRVFPPPPEVRDLGAVLEVRDLWAGPLRGVGLKLARGEVLGIAGLLGSGRTELLRAIFGDLAITSGTVSLSGRPLRLSGPADAMRAGIAYVPENRVADGAFHDQPVSINMSLASLSQYWRRGHMAYRDMRRDARGLMGDFHVKAASEESVMATLSGGNQQKVILARWLRRKPTLLLLDEPTQGVDVGARAEIYSLIRRSVVDGAAAIVVASDFEELAHVSDRVAILQGGRFTGEATPPELTADRLTQLLYRKPTPAMGA
jgi:ribose transport system ATP-binding protein